MAGENIREIVRERYGAAAKAVTQGKAASCCGGGRVVDEKTDPITRNLYSAEQSGAVPVEALAASLGCGNPTALAELKPGEVVLDLGSGGGIDVLLSAKRVGPAGKAYGLDMTDEMLALARENQRKAGATNVEFLRGTIENIPLPNDSVDVIISNCVINLSADKDAVLREAFRVLKPGGRFAVSDIVLRRPLPEALQRDMALWTGCVAGALVEADYRAKLQAAGFEAVDVEPTRIYTADDAAEVLGGRESASSSCCGAGGRADASTLAETADAVMSAFVRARKPGAEKDRS
jgi:SAM-dependent methyltransferase